MCVFTDTSVGRANVNLIKPPIVPPVTLAVPTSFVHFDAMATYHSSSSYSGEGSSHAGTSTYDKNWHQTATPGDVTTAVHNLLSSTKRLQEVLRLWGAEKASEGDVSDVYVQIGHEFNATINAFAYHQIDLSEIHSIPADLRDVLERCLSEEPAPEVLESFMPALRKVLYKLLKGLQSRQDAWRAATQRGGARSLNGS
ncbi:hypothetical protein NLJ89_g11697 [Agrocybe chaxingu]|uniref:Aip3p/Bud6 N-terminal domain-containing protein n=1 Tax=Agrocybe chaxingu TaxID=84603 RepID=A0A9W8MPS2_9AGAR|nr:hypothetical protein NLJ89_g11697 [Agrocybe chaxingu]